MEEIQMIRFSNNIPSKEANESILSTDINNLSNVSSFGIKNSKVIVNVEPTCHMSGSSAVVTSNITNYPWKFDYLPGNLVSVHYTGNFIAYAIIAPNSQSGIVRIISRVTGERTIIKNIAGLVKDLTFASILQSVVLAFVDSFGTLYVYDITEEDKALSAQLILEVKRDADKEYSDYQRVIWCPYIPEDPVEAEESPDSEGEENPAYFLVVTSGSSAEIFHVRFLTDSNGPGPLDRSKLDLGAGYQVIESHDAPISDAAFSPDGTALATASLDGFVKFFQVEKNTSSPRCLHEWKPHDGKPLSCLFFLDNHKKPSPDDQFWKFAVTGACNNSEIKTWSCQTWECNQLLNFKLNDAPESSESSNELTLKAAIDPSSNYLILSDIKRRVLYVMIISNEQDEEKAVNGTGEGVPSAKEEVVRIVSISELPVQYPVLFLSITNAEWKSYKRWKHEHHASHALFDHDRDGSDEEDEENDADVVEGLVMKTVLISTKSLQEATARFQPAVLPSSNFAKVHRASNQTTLLNLSTSQDSVVLRDGLTDLSLNITSSLSEADISLNVTNASKSKELEEAKASLLEKNAVLSSFPSKTPATLSETTLDEAVSSPIFYTTPVSKESTTTSSRHSITHATTLPSPMVVPSIPSVPITLNLLTPESFSSPGRVEDEEAENGSRDKPSRQSCSPTKDLKSAALSILLGVNSSSATEEASGEDGSNVLETAVSGSSRSSPVMMLPSPPRSNNLTGLMTKDLPLATSEVSTQPKTAAAPLDPSFDLSSSSAPSCNKPAGNAAALASSTSSPSLEVQQILHTHNNLNNDFNDEEKLVIEDLAHLKSGLSKAAASSTAAKPEPVVTDPISRLLFEVPAKTTTMQNSLVDILTPLDGEGISFMCNEIEKKIKEPKTEDLIDSFEDPVPPKPQTLNGIKTEESPLLVASKQAEITQREVKLEEDLNDLRELVMSSRNSQLSHSKEILANTKKLGDRLGKQESSLKQIEKSLEDIKRSNKEFLDKIPKLITSTAKPIVENALRMEIRNSLGPAVARCSEPFRTQLSNDIRSMVSHSEATLTDSLTRATCSRSFVETVSNNVASALTLSVQTACRESYNKVVMPGFNAIAQQIFGQLNDSFTRGTKEYIRHVESDMQNKSSAVVDSVKSGSQTLETASATLSTNANALMETLQKTLAQQTSFTDMFGDRLKQTVRDEVSKALQEHHATVEARASRAQTPAQLVHSTSNPKMARQHIQQLISQGQSNSAFKQALSASDLSLVVYVCERINPQQLFSQTPCPLTQDVLLSLVNQLSHDLSTYTDMKTKYLEEAVMNLDTGHPVTREHMRQVLQSLQRSLKSHIEINPNHKKLKMLLMAVNHLVAA